MISKTTTKSKKFKEIEKKDGTTHKDRHYRFKTTYNKQSKSTKGNLDTTSVNQQQQGYL